MIMLTVRRIFLFDTVIAGLFGFALILIPAELCSFLEMGAVADRGSIVLARLLGASLIGIGATEWLARNVSLNGTLPILRGILWFDILALVVSLNATLSHTVNSMGWVVVSLFLFFGLARVFLGFRPQNS